MASTQLNSRIDADIKSAGDAAFATIGYTPSRVIQATWGFAARNRNNKKALQRLAELLDDSPTQPKENKKRSSWLKTGPQAYLDMLAEMGIEEVPEPLSSSDEELLLQAHLDKMTERGVDA